MVRLTVEPSDTFAKLGDQVGYCLIVPLYIYSQVQLLEVLPPNVNPRTISLSPHPTGAESKLIQEIAKFCISQIKLR